MGGVSNKSSEVWKGAYEVADRKSVPKLRLQQFPITND